MAREGPPASPAPPGGTAAGGVAAVGPNVRQGAMLSSPSAPLLLLGGSSSLEETAYPRSPKLPVLDAGAQGANVSAGARRGYMVRGSPAAPTALPQIAGGGGSEASSSRRTRALSQDELQKLPTAEAVRQVLIQRAGSLRQAYAALDVHGTGKVDAMDFEKGLTALHIYASPVGNFLSIQTLFDTLAEGSAELSLHDLLGYVPIERRPSAKDGDTHTKWFDYHNKTSAMKSRLVRQPAWHPHRKDRQERHVLPPIGAEEPTPPPSFEEAESARRQRRRDLRRQFREARNAMQSDEKRELVGGLVHPEDAPEHFANEQRRVARHRSRIEGAIRDCSRSRQQLVDMQKMLSHLSDQGKHAAVDEDLRVNLKMALMEAIPRRKMPSMSVRGSVSLGDLADNLSQSPKKASLKARIDPAF